MSKKVLLITGDGVEALEVFYPYYRCLEEGFEATIASPSVKKLYTVVHDFVDDKETYIELPAYGLESHVAFEDVDPSDYDGLIIPGGRAPEYIRLNEHVPSIVKHFFDENKPVAIVCHASQVLTVIPGLTDGRKYTAYIACKPEVQAADGTYMDEALYVDNNLISGHAWPDLPGLMREFMKLMK